MKLYSKKFARRSMKKQAKSMQETRDAILWDILLEDNTCRVKIQGSDEYIIAHFPRNWRAVPYWLKRGNAVRILHRGGNRGYVEVIGEGRAIPTALSGSSMPDEQLPSNGVVSGFKMSSTIESSSTDELIIKITEGTYRIEDIEYNLSIEEDLENFDADECLPYDNTEENSFFYYSTTGGVIYFALDPAPGVGYFRYDAFCIGIDGEIDYLKGDESIEPVKPTVPGSHILLGDYILVIGGATEINEENIGMVWTERHASTLIIDIEGNGVSYEKEWRGELDPLEYETSSTDIQIYLLDQYGWNINSYFEGTLTQNSGGGSFTNSEFSFYGSKSFDWIRDQLEVDSDIVVFTIEGTANGEDLISVGIITPLAPEVSA